MSGSYQFENLEGRHQEAAFLAERAMLRLDGFLPLLRRHGFPSTGKVLEVGCGHGIRTKIMAEHFSGEVVGLDRSTELLAMNSSSLANLSFQQGDLYALPFPDDSFDFVYVRLVFMHLHDPYKALAEIRRVLRKGGRVLLEDADRDCMFFEPAPASFSDFWEKVQEGQRKLGGDPNVGRKLGPYLKEFNFDAVQIETQPILGGGDEIDFLARTLMPSLNVYLDPKDRAAGQAAIDDLRVLAKDSRATFYHFWFVVSGEK